MSPMHWIVSTLAAGLFVAGNVLIIYKSYEFFDMLMPAWYPVKEVVTSNGSTTGKKLIKQAYGKYLVDANEPKNASWWKWTYKYLPKKTSSGDFANAINWSRNDSNAINKKCESLYGQEVKDLQDEKVADMWTYCSIGRSELITLDKEVRDADDKPLLSELDDDWKKKLVSTKHMDNIWWWKLRKNEFATKKLTSNHYNASNMIMSTCEDFYTDEQKWKKLTYVSELLKICGFNY